MSAPSYDVDFYSDEFIREPWPHYVAMRKLGPLVWLPRHGNYALTRYQDVNRRSNLTPYRLPILTPLSGSVWR